MDQIDRQILKILQQDGRIAINQLSKQLHLSRPSITERLRRLQENGTILGYTARISSKKMGKEVLAIVQIRNLKVACRRFEEKLEEENDILECHRVTGDNSYFIKAAFASMHDLEAFVDRLIPFGQLNTSIVLSSPIPNNMIWPNEEQ